MVRVRLETEHLDVSNRELRVSNEHVDDGTAARLCCGHESLVS
jgi:hypothetical protein